MTWLGCLMTSFGGLGIIEGIRCCNKLKNSFRWIYSVKIFDIFRANEDQLNAFIVISILLFCIGLVLIVLGIVKNKNQKKLNTISNLNQKNYCSHCNITVNSDNSKCPNCGNELK